MDSVDDDGSGELEFPEFQLILKEKLGIGKETTTKWESKHKDGVTSHSKYFGELSVFGESSVNAADDATPMTGQLRCTEDALICYITKERYHHILEHGFGGDLKRKQDILYSHAVVQQCVTRSDLKRIAHACKLEELRVQKRLFAQVVRPPPNKNPNLSWGIAQGTDKPVVPSAIPEGGDAHGAYLHL